VEVVIKELHAVLDDARDIDVAGLSDRELEAAVVELAAVKSRVAALEATVAGEWDARKLWTVHGARSAASWLAWKGRQPVAACRRAPRWGRKLRDLPAVTAAWSAGRIGDAHVQRILSLDSPRTHDALVTDQVDVTRWAMTLAWRLFVRRLQDWVDEHDPDGADPDGRDGRRLHCSRTTSDWWRLDGWLDPVAGSIVARELDRLERELFLHDQRKAAERFDPDALPHQFARTAAQRRADAVVLMAERSATLPDDGRRGRPLFTVLVGQDSLRRILELTNGVELRPSQLVEYVEPARFEQVLFDTPTHVVGVSSQRTYRGLLRTAIEARDRGCQFPGCDAPIDDCQIDHIIPAAAGGPTSQDNGRCYCGPHNRARHRLQHKQPPPDDDP
jgi:hypothetical protein